MDIQIPVSDTIRSRLASLKEDSRVQAAIEFLVPDQDTRLEEQIAIAKVPAFSYHEEERARAMAEFFRQYGLTEITTDRFGNVYGVRRGTGNGPAVLIDAHTDSVFPMYTELEPKRDGSRIYMPGITDDASGRAAMLSVLRALNREEISTVGDLYFAGIVEEEPGILGMPKFLSEHTFDAVISLDCAGSNWFAVGASGECFYEIRFRSKEERINYGRYSQCLTAAARAAIKVAGAELPDKTMIIAHDLLSDVNKGQGCTTSLTKLIVQVRACRPEGVEEAGAILRKIAEEAAREENESFGEDRVSFEILKDEQLTPGYQDLNNPICGAAYHIMREMGVEEPRVVETGNSNSGAALRVGTQAVTLGTGGEHGGIHSLQEFFDTTDMHKGPQTILQLVLMMAGMEGVTEPLA